RTRSKVEFSTVVDPELGGGFVLEYDTSRLDASLRTQIQELRRTLA
ncbi:MAG: F0F1 ATP synthase subunit delta, partial [Alloprevotella sp.]|nr:F0F1 ATP synthase subunit delta [Alloprevotella sp.]